MALQSAFKERFEDLESSRNHRISLLQDEKQLQKNKSVVLSAKHSNIGLLEQRCLILDQKFASDNFRISSLKSEIELLDRRFHSCSRELRDLNVEVEELEHLDREREKDYARKCAEMNEFKDATQKFSADLRIKVEELRCRRHELKLLCSELEKNHGDLQNVDTQDAEIRNSELWASKKKVASTLESNEREKLSCKSSLKVYGDLEKTKLQKQLESLR